MVLMEAYSNVGLYVDYSRYAVAHICVTYGRHTWSEEYATNVECM